MAADVHADKESEAYGYAGRLAEALHRKHFAHVVNWQPLDTVLGVLTQIDNMTSGLQSAEEGRNEEHLTSNAKLADEIEREGVERVVYGMDLTNTRKLNRQLIDALRATHSAIESIPQPGVKDPRPCVHKFGATTCGYPQDFCGHEGSSEPAPPAGRHVYAPPPDRCAK